MQNKIKFMLLFFLSCATTALAQQPQWELFFPNISGPIAVDPTNSDVIYIAASGNAFEDGMWKTTDGGQTWNRYDEGWGMARPADILINPDNPQEILVGGAPFVGAHKSTDGGQTWVRADYGLRTDHHGYEVHQLAFDSQKSIYFLADVGGGAFCGVYRSVDGVQWEETSFYGCPLSIIVDKSNGDVYASSDVGNVRKSTDAGRTWVEKNNGLPTNSPPIWDVAKVSNSQTIYCVLVGYGIYKTLDGGENWFSVNDSITSQLNFTGGLVVSEADTNTIFAGARFSPVSIVRGIYQTRDGGRNWEQYNFGLPDTILDFATRNLFLDHHTNSLFADIALLFGNGRAEEGIYRLSNAVVTDISKRPEQVIQIDLNLKVYPNPFNAQTTLIYTVHTKGELTLQIFNILGKEVVRLLEETVYPGEYRIHWDGTNREGRQVPSGIYLARMRLGVNAKTIKLLILK